MLSLVYQESFVNLSAEKKLNLSLFAHDYITKPVDLSVRIILRDMATFNLIKNQNPPN